MVGKFVATNGSGGVLLITIWRRVQLIFNFNVALTVASWTVPIVVAPSRLTAMRVLIQSRAFADRTESDCDGCLLLLFSHMDA